MQSNTPESYQNQSKSPSRSLPQALADYWMQRAAWANNQAHRTPDKARRDGWFNLKNRWLSLAIETLAPYVFVANQIQPSGRTELTVSNSGTCVHTHASRLSEKAQARVRFLIEAEGGPK